MSFVVAAFLLAALDMATRPEEALVNLCRRFSILTKGTKGVFVESLVYTLTRFDSLIIPVHKKILST